MGLNISKMWLLLLASAMPGTNSKILMDTYTKWMLYSMECKNKMEVQPHPDGLFCNRSFDQYACWPDGQPDSLVNVSCPPFMPWFEKVRGGLAFRRCGADGQWVLDGDDLPWRDISQCQDESPKDNGTRRLLEGFKKMYTVGYSLSLAALVLALATFLMFRRLHCTRNYIHMNLFGSFILRAMSILVKDALLETHWEVDPSNATEWGAFLSAEAAVSCRTAQVLMQYCIVANYCWLLVEGLYLHTLLSVTVFSEEAHFRLYLLIGWGTPVIFVTPWVAMKFLRENSECWSQNNNLSYWWIIRSAILLANVINFVIFIRILKILISKLRAHQMGYTDYKFRLAKSTLTLIPLLGIHEVVVALITDEQARGALRILRLFYLLFLNSFQGLLVAILYCFVTREVQAEVRKRWHRWRLGQDLQGRHMYISVTRLRPSIGRAGNGDAGEKRDDGSAPFGAGPEAAAAAFRTDREESARPRDAPFSRSDRAPRGRLGGYLSRDESGSGTAETSGEAAAGGGFLPLRQAVCGRAFLDERKTESDSGGTLTDGDLAPALVTETRP
ncbi:unnamed protein product [Lampetra fluviatilis]